MCIKLVIFDFDGCFTDGKVLFDTKGDILKYYNVKDGMGIKLLKENDIKVGIISGYKENNSQLEIIKHLKIDYYSFGNNKLNVLKEWCEELNINLENEVAYMGDDINDIDVLENVSISGCPKDAHKDVLNICEFVSSKDGGYGCIREFCDYLISNEKENKNKPNILKDIKLEMYYQLKNIDIKPINILATKIHDTKTTNNIYFCGVGKSENISIHCCNLLKSIGINAFNLNILNSIHGDIGSLKENDLILLFSKSGNTKEIIELIPYLKNKCCELIGICCNNNSKFKELCDETIILPFKNEIKCNIDCLPTNSIMSFVFFTNILVSQLCNTLNLQKCEYKLNHPAGNIGNSLKQIKDILIKEFPKIILNENNIYLSKIFLEMTTYKIGCCFFVNNQQELLGILTDGDIRRLLLKNVDLKEITKNEINTNFYYETDTHKFIKGLKHYNYIPILSDLKLIGIINKFN